MPFVPVGTSDNLGGTTTIARWWLRRRARERGVIAGTPDDFPRKDPVMNLVSSTTAPRAAGAALLLGVSVISGGYAG